jgi:hypothetical protein
MKLSSRVLLFCAALSGALSTSCSTNNTPEPSGMLPYSGPVPSSFGASCKNGDFGFVVGSYGTCTGSYYLLCSGGKWSEYSCEHPVTCYGCMSWEGDADSPAEGG